MTIYRPTASPHRSYAVTDVIGLPGPGLMKKCIYLILLNLLVTKKVIYYSILIQSSSSNDRFVKINPNKYKDSYITFMTVLFRPNQVMFNNVDSANVVTNSNDEEITIPPGYYAIGQIIVILNTMTDTTFSISTKAFELWVYLYPFLTHHRFHQCSGYSRNPWFGRASSHSIRFVLWIERD